MGRKCGTEIRGRGKGRREREGLKVVENVASVLHPLIRIGGRNDTSNRETNPFLKICFIFLSRIVDHLVISKSPVFPKSEEKGHCADLCRSMQAEYSTN